MRKRFQDVDEDYLKYVDNAAAMLEAFERIRVRSPQEDPAVGPFRRQLASYVVHLFGEETPLYLAFLDGYLTGITDKPTMKFLLQHAGLVVTEKQLKGGDWRQRSIERLLFRFSKKSVKRMLDSKISMVAEPLIQRILAPYGSVERFAQQTAEEMNGEWVEQLQARGEHSHERHLVGASTRKAALYEALTLLGRTEEAERLAQSFEELDWRVMEAEFIKGAYYLVGSEQLCAAGDAERTYADAVRKAGDDVKRNEREKRHSDEELQVQISGINRKADRQLNEAIRRIGELERLAAEQAEQLAHYEAMLEEYERRLSSHHRGLALAGMHVLVVGHFAQRRMYQEEIAVRGGFCEFFPAVVDDTNIRLLAGAFRRADLVLYITTFTQHKVHDFLRKQAGAERKLVFLNCKGRASFVRELDDYLLRRHR